MSVLAYANHLLAGRRRVRRALGLPAMSFEAFDAKQARVAAQTYRDYGRGSDHRAGLNLGDTYSYALASVTRSRI